MNPMLSCMDNKVLSGNHQLYFPSGFLYTACVTFSRTYVMCRSSLNTAKVCKVNNRAWRHIILTFTIVKRIFCATTTWLLSFFPCNSVSLKIILIRKLRAVKFLQTFRVLQYNKTLHHLN